MTFTTLLINTCTVQRFTADDIDDYGNPTGTWDDSDEACRLMAGTGKEIKVGAEVVIADYKLFIGGDVDITEQDKVIIGLVTYEVLLVADRQDGIQGHHKECYLRVVR